MRIPKALVLIVVAMIAGAAGAGLTAAVTVGATGSHVTYYGCLSPKLSKVGTVAPKCPSKSTVIDWNSVGPQGIQGLQGVQGQKGDTGATGPQGPGAVSTTTQFIQPNGSSMSLNLSTGQYVVTWDLSSKMCDGRLHLLGHVDEYHSDLPRNLSGSRYRRQWRRNRHRRMFRERDWHGAGNGDPNDYPLARLSTTSTGPEPSTEYYPGPAPAAGEALIVRLMEELALPSSSSRATQDCVVPFGPVDGVVIGLSCAK